MPISAKNKKNLQRPADTGDSAADYRHFGTEADDSLQVFAVFCSSFLQDRSWYAI